jgi:DNA-binding HxlR family transcriptional regulator
MDGISPKVLTQTLRGMERDGLLVRTVFAVAPPRVEYELTALGKSALAPLRELCLWAKANAGQRDQARRMYDAALRKA